jgi:hypothetical protein
MATKKRGGKADLKRVELAELPEGSIAMFDTGTKEMALVNLDGFKDHLEKEMDAVRQALARAERLGSYGLTGIDLCFGLKLGIVVLGVEGGITLHYTRPLGKAES